MVRKKKQPAPSAPMGAPEWVVTFTDMISLLVTFFVLLMTFSSLDAREVLKVASILTGNRGVHANKSFAPEELKDDLLAATDLIRGAVLPHSRPAEELIENLEEMGQRSDDEHVSIDLNEVSDGLVIEFDSRASFLPGSATVNAELAKSLGEIGRVLEHYPHLVVVEGFTDSGFRPTPTYRTADEMGFARGSAAARVLLEESHLPASLVQVASHGDRRPRADESTAVGRQENRRVQIRLLSLSRLRASHLAAERERAHREDG